MSTNTYADEIVRWRSSVSNQKIYPLSQAKESWELLLAAGELEFPLLRQAGACDPLPLPILIGFAAWSHEVYIADETNSPKQHPLDPCQITTLGCFLCNLALDGVFLPKVKKGEYPKFISPSHTRLCKFLSLRHLKDDNCEQAILLIKPLLISAKPRIARCPINGVITLMDNWHTNRNKLSYAIATTVMDRLQSQQ